MFIKIVSEKPRYNVKKKSLIIVCDLSPVADNVQKYFLCQSNFKKQMFHIEFH